MSFRDIASALGKSRNAIIGKCHRLQLPKRGNEHQRIMAQKAAKARWGDAPRPQKPKHFSLKRASPKERKPPMFLRVVSVPDSKPVPLMERTGCCYPTTGEKPHLYCNEPISKGEYCGTHYRVIYTRVRAA